MKIRAILYTRVATIEQDKQDSNNTDYQTKRLKNYCEKTDIEVIKIYNEYASGANFENRPQWQECLEFIKDKNKEHIQIILFTRWDIFCETESEIQKMARILAAYKIETTAIEQPFKFYLETPPVKKGKGKNDSIE